MNNSENTSRLRIYASSTDKIDGTPVYEAIVFMAKHEGIAGATAFRGIIGYGASSVIHSSKFWELTEKLPMVIEIIDKTRIVESFFELIKPKLERMSKGCLVTMEKVDVMLYKAGNRKT